LDADTVLDPAFDPNIFGTIFAAEAVDMLALDHRPQIAQPPLPPPLAKLIDPKLPWYNSGVVAFRSLAVAQKISTAWRAQYAILSGLVKQDEFALQAVLQAQATKVAPLAANLNSFTKAGSAGGIWHDSRGDFTGE
jgi:hypothetical protein